MTTPSLRSALSALPPAYAALLQRATEAVREDDRVRALWLSGSVARGHADAVSDLDLLLAVRDEDIAAFAADWRGFLARIAPSVIARPLPFLPGSFYSLTTRAERLDVVVEAVGRLGSTPFRARRVVLDKDGLTASVPAPALEPGPSPARVAFLVEEFLRDYGMLPVAATRRDLLLGIEGIHVMRGLLYQLFCQANAPLAITGVKHWSAQLTARQRALLEALPTGGRNLSDMIEATTAVSRAFLTEARPLCAALGVPWPAELETTVLQHLRDHGLPALDGPARA